MNIPPTIRSGQQIPHLDGTNDHLISSRGFWNTIIATCNSFLNMKGLKLSENNSFIQTGTIEKKTSPLKWLVVTQLGSQLDPPLPDLLICSTYTPPAPGSTVRGTSAGDTIYVAKDPEFRSDVTAEFFLDNGDNVTQTYTYFTRTDADETYGDNFRLANDGTNSEIQVVDPRYMKLSLIPDNIKNVKQALIFAQDLGVPTGVLDPDGNPVTMVEERIREWGRYATQ